MPYPIVLYPDKRLNQSCEEVTEITEELIQMLDKMHETMVLHDGVGLAAPQIGKNIRIAIIQADPEEDVIELINPILIESEGEDIDIEACLSIPDQYGTVARAQRIVVRFFDREGVEYELEAADYLARIIQHEMDHLDGILFIEKVIKKLTLEEIEKYGEDVQDD